MKHLKRVNEMLSSRYDQDIIDGFMDDIKDMGLDARIVIHANSMGGGYDRIVKTGFKDFNDEMKNAPGGRDINKYLLQYNIEIDQVKKPGHYRDGAGSSVVTPEMIEEIKEMVSAMEGKLDDFTDLKVSEYRITWSNMYTKTKDYIKEVKVFISIIRDKSKKKL